MVYLYCILPFEGSCIKKCVRKVNISLLDTLLYNLTQLYHAGLSIAFLINSTNSFREVKVTLSLDHIPSQ